MTQNKNQDDEKMIYRMDWELNQRDFRRQVRDLIHQAERRNKVIALPIGMDTGKMLGLLTILLAEVNCDNCDAGCCKGNPNGELTELLEPEYQRLSEMYGDHHFVVEGDKYYMVTPCPFLKQNRCSIYPHRPLVCILYPFQPGGADGSGDTLMAVASSCPEAKRIARNVFMTAWRLRQQYALLGNFDFLKD